MNTIEEHPQEHENVVECASTSTITSNDINVTIEGLAVQEPDTLRRRSKREDSQSSIGTDGLDEQYQMEENDSNFIQNFEFSDQHFDPAFGRHYFYEALGKDVMYGAWMQHKKDERQGTDEKNTSASTPSSTAAPAKQGWITKYGEVMHTRKKRWLILEKSPDAGAVLSFYRGPDLSSCKGSIHLTATTRIEPKDSHHGSKENEFIVTPSTDPSDKPVHLIAETPREMSSWMAAIKTEIKKAPGSWFIDKFKHLYEEAGNAAFLVRFGVRKRNARHYLQTRVIEFDFFKRVIHNTKRGETQTSIPFSALCNVTITATGYKGDGYGMELDFRGHHRAWPVYHDTQQARDDMFSLAKHIVKNDIEETSLRRRWPRLLLKTGFVVRRNVAHEDNYVGPHATLRGRLFIALYEYQMHVLSPENQFRSRPWFIFSLPGLQLAHKAEKKLLILGRHSFVCSSQEECEDWFNAILAAATIPTEVVENEMAARLKLKNMHCRTVHHLNGLLKAQVKPEGGNAPRDFQQIQLMIRILWVAHFEDLPWEGNSSPKWLEIGFQRGGPASDLRSSGLLGIHCLIYFVLEHRDQFKSMLGQQAAVLSGGRQLNYPIAIAGINVITALVEVLGIGDSGSHSVAWSTEASTAFARLMMKTMGSPSSDGPALPEFDDSDIGAVLDKVQLVSLYRSTYLTQGNVVFEDMFCMFLPLLDRLFNQMGAGYMEFGQVFTRFKERLYEIFETCPESIEDLKQSVEEQTDEKQVVSPLHL